MTTHVEHIHLDDDGHVPAADMARYVDGTASRDEREMVTHHLADCDLCREELTALRRLVPRRSHLTRNVSAVLGAAAALTLITLSWRGTLASTVDTTRPDSTRASDVVPEIDAPFLTVSPAMDTLIAADRVTLVWRGAGTDVTYTFVVYDESGGVAYSGETNDTLVTVPPAAFKSQASRADSTARTYTWMVQTKLLDGRSARTDPQRLRVR